MRASQSGKSRIFKRDADASISKSRYPDAVNPQTDPIVMGNRKPLSVSELNCPLKAHVRAVSAATRSGAVHDGGAAVYYSSHNRIVQPENVKLLTGGAASGCALSRKLSTVLLTLLLPVPSG